MPFEVLAINDSRWPELVRQAQGDIFYEPSYCQFMTRGTPHRPVMLLYRDDLGTVFDVSVEKAISSLPFFADIADKVSCSPIDLASPDYNSPIVLADPRDSVELLMRYRRSVDRYCLEMGAVTEFIRFHPLSQSTGISVDLLDAHPGSEILYVDLRFGYDKAFSGYRKGHKSTVKKARREGAGFRFCPSGDADGIAKLYQLYSETMKRKDAKSVYLYRFEHFQNMAQYLGDRIVIMQSLVGDQIASANIFLLGRKHIWFKYSGLDQRYRGSGAHTFMLDRAIHWACEQGFDHFMLGGGIETGDSTYSSKRGFSHLSACVHHVKKIHDEKMMNLLIEAKKAYDSRFGLQTKDSYFPSYWLN